MSLWTILGVDCLRESIALPSKSAETSSNESHETWNAEKLEMFTIILCLETDSHLAFPSAMRMSLVVLFFSFKQTFLNGDVHMSQILSKNKSDKNY